MKSQPIRDSLCSIRNSFVGFLYKHVLKPIYFKFDPEDVHDRVTMLGVLLSKTPITRWLTSLAFDYRHPALKQTVLGIPFENPIGLSAGFDKNAQLTNIMPDVGFGFEEVGSITGEYCPGNPKPRLWRMKGSESLMVYYGLKNDGAEAISKRLAGKKFRFPIGISIAKTNNEATVDTSVGVADYVKAYRAFKQIGSYYTINVSCPNTFGGEPFHDPNRLELLLAAIDREEKTKPIFIKISPDLPLETVDGIIEVASNHRIDGFIISNLTKNRNNPKIDEHDFVPEKGGMSGKVVEDLATDMIKYVYAKARNRFVIIGCGGVFTAEDAYRKIRSGATLIHMITGMIFGGPQTISSINLGLVSLLKRDGYESISEAIGADVP